MTTYHLPATPRRLRQRAEKPVAIGSTFQKAMASDEDAIGMAMIPGQAWWFVLQNKLGGKPNWLHILYGVNDGTVKQSPKGTYSLVIYASTAAKHAGNDIAGQSTIAPEHIDYWLGELFKELKDKDFETPYNLELTVNNVIYELYHKFNRNG